MNRQLIWITVVSIRKKIHGILPTVITDVESNTAALEPELYLDCFCPVDLSELTAATVSSKPSTCILDPIPTEILRHPVEVSSC